MGNESRVYVYEVEVRPYGDYTSPAGAWHIEYKGADRNEALDEAEHHAGLGQQVRVSVSPRVRK